MANDNDRSDRPSGFMPDDFDRELARLDRVQGVARTRPALFQYIPLLGIGGTATYSVTTFREAGEIEEATEGAAVRRKPPTFTVFLEVGKGRELTRIMIPHSVAMLISRQRDALTEQAARRSAKQAAETRKERGYKPTPPPRRGGKSKSR